VLVTNYLGIRKQSLVYDRTENEEVWSRPVLGFRVTAINQQSAHFYHVKSEVDYIGEARLPES
jgi:hypothetical protein